MVAVDCRCSLFLAEESVCRESVDDEKLPTPALEPAVEATLEPAEELASLRIGGGLNKATTVALLLLLSLLSDCCDAFKLGLGDPPGTDLVGEYEIRLYRLILEVVVPSPKIRPIGV